MYSLPQRLLFLLLSLLSVSAFAQIEGDYATADSKAFFGADTRAWFRRSHPETQRIWQLGLDFKAATDVPVKVNVMYYPFSHTTYPARAAKWEDEGQPWVEFTVRDRPYSRDYDWSQDVMILKPDALEDVLPDSITDQVLEEVIQPLISGQEVYLFWEGENRNLANETRSDSTEVRTAIRWGMECFNYYLANGKLPDVPQPSSAQAVFVANPNQTYGHDPVNLLLPSDYPEVIIQDSVPYRLAWKSQLALGESGAVADSIAFELEGISNQATLSLSTPLGSYPVTRRGGNSFGASLPPQPEGESQAEVLYRPDADTDPIVMGLLNVLAYAQESRTVHVIPVSQERPDGASLQAKLNEIYGPAVTDWTVQVEPVWNNIAWDKDERGVNLEESGLLTAYPPELKNLINRYSWQFSYNPNHYYLFLVNLASTEGNVSGYMPRKRNKGFVFTNVTGQNTESFQHTAAHELGHGAFRFDHWWPETGLPQGTTDNLMDYGGGTALAKRQWEYIRNPQEVNTLGEEDEDAASGVFVYTDEVDEAALADCYYMVKPSGGILGLPIAEAPVLRTQANVSYVTTRFQLGDGPEYHYDGVLDAYITMEGAAYTETCATPSAPAEVFAVVWHSTCVRQLNVYNYTPTAGDFPGPEALTLERSGSYRVTNSCAPSGSVSRQIFTRYQNQVGSPQQATALYTLAGEYQSLYNVLAIGDWEATGVDPAAFFLTHAGPYADSELPPWKDNMAGYTSKVTNSVAYFEGLSASALEQLGQDALVRWVSEWPEAHLRALSVAARAHAITGLASERMKGHILGGLFNKKTAEDALLALIQPDNIPTEDKQELVDLLVAKDILATLDDEYKDGGTALTDSNYPIWANYCLQLVTGAYPPPSEEPLELFSHVLEKEAIFHWGSETTFEYLNTGGAIPLSLPGTYSCPTLFSAQLQNTTVTLQVTEPSGLSSWVNSAENPPGCTYGEAEEFTFQYNEYIMALAVKNGKAAQAMGLFRGTGPGENVQFMPAIYLFHLANLQEDYDQQKRDQVTLDVIIVAISLATLPVSGPVGTAIGVIDATAAIADMAINLGEDAILAEFPENGADFVRNFRTVTAVVGIGALAYGVGTSRLVTNLKGSLDDMVKFWELNKGRLKAALTAEQFAKMQETITAVRQLASQAAQQAITQLGEVIKRGFDESLALIQEGNLAYSNAPAALINHGLW
ncbi:MAG TPA: hypothetical protein DCR93_35025, partial [Cytophagales bacterium]|nr:hypothetical protein [Cytophagales bacterium]